MEGFPRRGAGRFLGVPRDTTSTGHNATCDGGACVVPGLVQALSSAQPPTLKLIKEMEP